MNINREFNNSEGYEEFDEFDFDNIFISDEIESTSISISDDEFIFELSDDTTSVLNINDLSENVVSKNVMSENDKLLISQLEFLIDNNYLPLHLHPIDNLITDEYITKISSYLYKIFIHRKLFLFENKKNYYRTYKSSPLKISHTPNDMSCNDSLKTSLDNLMTTIKKDLEFMDNICKKFSITEDEIV